MTDKEQESKGVYAKTPQEAADRGRKLGLEGDIEVSPTTGITKDDGNIKAWKVKGEVKDADR